MRAEHARPTPAAAAFACCIAVRAAGYGPVRHRRRAGASAADAPTLRVGIGSVAVGSPPIEASQQFISNISHRRPAASRRGRAAATVAGRKLGPLAGRPVADSSICARTSSSTTARPSTPTIVANILEQSLPKVMGPAFDDVESITRRRRSRSRDSTFDSPSPFVAGSARDVPIQQARQRRSSAPGRSRQPVRRRPTEMRGERRLLPGPADHRPNRRSRRIRTSARRGPNCCATISTCCTRSDADALDSLQDVEQRLGVHVRPARISTSSFFEHASRRSCKSPDVRRALNAGDRSRRLDPRRP